MVDVHFVLQMVNCIVIVIYLTSKSIGIFIIKVRSFLYTFIAKTFWYLYSHAIWMLWYFRFFQTHKFVHKLVSKPLITHSYRSLKTLQAQKLAENHVLEAQHAHVRHQVHQHDCSRSTRVLTFEISDFGGVRCHCFFMILLAYHSHFHHV